MSLTIHPMGTYCLLRYLPSPPPPGRIVQVKQTVDAVRRARIEAIGPDVLDHQPGQTVLVSALVGVLVETDLVLAEETALLADFPEE